MASRLEQTHRKLGVSKIAETINHKNGIQYIDDNNPDEFRGSKGCHHGNAKSKCCKYKRYITNQDKHIGHEIDHHNQRCPVLGVRGPVFYKLRCQKRQTCPGSNRMNQDAD